MTARNLIQRGHEIRDTGVIKRLQYFLRGLFLWRRRFHLPLHRHPRGQSPCCSCELSFLYLFLFEYKGVFLESGYSEIKDLKWFGKECFRGLF